MTTSSNKSEQEMATYFGEGIPIIGLSEERMSAIKKRALTALVFKGAEYIPHSALDFSAVRKDLLEERGFSASFKMHYLLGNGLHHVATGNAGGCHVHENYNDILGQIADAVARGSPLITDHAVTELILYQESEPMLGRMKRIVTVSLEASGRSEEKGNLFIKRVPFFNALIKNLKSSGVSAICFTEAGRDYKLPVATPWETIQEQLLEGVAYEKILLKPNNEEKGRCFGILAISFDRELELEGIQLTKKDLEIGAWGSGAVMITTLEGARVLCVHLPLTVSIEKKGREFLAALAAIRDLNPDVIVGDGNLISEGSDSASVAAERYLGFVYVQRLGHLPTFAGNGYDAIPIPSEKEQETKGTLVKW